jgi:hypothetical protein
MYVIRLPNGNLRVPQSSVSDDGRTIGQGYIEIGPDDPDYQRLLAESITEEQLAERQRRWRDEDETLRLQFEEWKAGQPEDS